MLSTRVKAAFVFVPLVLILIYVGGWIFYCFIALVLLLAAWEFSHLFEQFSTKPCYPLICSGILLFVLQRWFLAEASVGILLSLFMFIAILVVLVQYEMGVEDAALRFTISLGGVFYLGWVGSFFISLRSLPDGLGWTLTALPITWLADSGAYFVGRWLGKRPMSPKLSPNKTWAGFVGGILWGTASGILLVLLWRSVRFLPPGTRLWQGAVMGLVLAALTPMGDLIISLIKRSAGVKDTGSLIPGHGGILDRIDTWIWGAMLGYYMVRLFGGW